MKFWKRIEKNIHENKKVALLTVVENRGSSPGKQGFKMLVEESGELLGSIGGGMTEHKLVERAKIMLKENINKVEFHKQVHRSDDEMFKSGMICSGENTAVISVLNYSHKDMISSIIETLNMGNKATLIISPEKIDFSPTLLHEDQYNYKFLNETEGIFTETIGYKDIVCIIGAGHVGLALSQIMKQLGFFVKIFDNRPNLDTLAENNFANEKHIIKYKEIADFIPEGKNVYVVIMSFSHINDKLALSKLIHKNVMYLGLMGSKNKVKAIKSDMLNEGFSKSDLDKVSAPIGVKINSETPPEIAISIAAEIIKIRNFEKKQKAKYNFKEITNEQ